MHIMRRIDIIYKWKNKEVKTTLNDEEILLLISALRKDSCYKELEEKIVYGLLGSNLRFTSDDDDIEEIEKVLKSSIDMGYKLQIGISIDDRI